MAGIDCTMWYCPVHAALYLVLAFFQASAVWILLKAEFLAITLALEYWARWNS